VANKDERRQQARDERLRLDAQQAEELRRLRMMRFGAGAFFAALVVVAVLVAVSQSGSDSGGDSSIEGAASIDSQLQGLDQKGITLGDPGAPVSIVEYGDLQCPVCGAFSEQVTPQLIKDEVRSGDAKLEFKNFTIIGPQSTVAAKAALAAAEQGRYWSFVELFYRNQGTENSGYVTDAFLEAVAKGAGVADIAKWNADRRDPALDDELAKVQDEATELGLNATPSLVVTGPGGQKVLTAPSLSALESAVNEVG
jgi:protein-disulfide isomerase